MVAEPTPTISITALHDTVSIVHIPLHLAESASSRIYWTVDDAPGLSNEFFNVTSNAIEIAIFGQTGLVDTYWADRLTGEIKLSADWRVFEISSGDSGETSNYDSPHLRHVSAPLSREGISILYQSSYFTDFLLVKASDFARASAIFAEQGWHVDPTAPPSSKRRSQLLSPATPLPRPSPPPLTPFQAQEIETPRAPELSVLPSPLACVGFSHALERATAERVRQLVAWPEQARTAWHRKRASYPLDAPRIVRSNSAPTRPESIPEMDQGRPFLSYTRTEDGASITTETRILRWMFGRRSRTAGSGPGVYAPEPIYGRGIGSEGSEEDVEGEVEADQDEDDEVEEEEEEEGVLLGTEFQLGGRLAAGYVTDTTDFGDSEAEIEETDEMEEGREGCRGNPGPGPELGSECPQGMVKEEGTMSRTSVPASSPVTPGQAQTIPISWTKTFGRHSPISFKTSVFAEQQASKRTAESGSKDDCGDLGHERGAKRINRREGSRDRKGRPGRKRCLQLDLRGVGLSDAASDNNGHSTATATATANGSHDATASSNIKVNGDARPGEPNENVPSNTYGEGLESAAHSMGNRDDTANEGKDRGNTTQHTTHGATKSTTHNTPHTDPSTSKTSVRDEEGEKIYHLDKSGLVTLFSDLLNSQNIRMLYSSTFHTANILVEARDVNRARRLLEGDARGRASSC